ncbi:microtubule-destabilizing protein 60 [Oryza glaberrima]|uniref:TPX2 C-terminal domain-containing protein n=2 Tax=Oryza TaxID=4527 RepID=I1QWM5_ORYGL|nr:microtubule-destabilizing protein 60 [Oryza glaberrima]
MEKTRKATSPKSSMTSSTGPKSPVRNGGSPPHKKSTSEFRGRKNEPQNLRKGGQDSITLDESKRRSPTSQTSPKRSSPKHEQPLSYFRLHTEERAIKRAGFNYQVASKINTNEIIRRFEEKLSKVIEEREIKMMRKEMVHKAQLMPAFDKPFHPQRSTRPLTVPKEPSFLRLKCCIGGEFHRHFCYNAKAIK